MRVMMIVRANNESETGAMPEQKMIEEMTKFNEEMAKAGVLLDADGLHPSSGSVRIKYSGKNRTVIKGPFPANELIAGYWILKVKSLDEAIEWAKGAPNPMSDTSYVEIRQIFEMEEFGEAATPELKEREERIREQVGKR